MSTSHWKPKLLSHRATSLVGSLSTLTLHCEDASGSSTDLFEKPTSTSRLGRNVLEELMGGRRRSSSLQLWEQRAGAIRDSRSVMEMLSMAEYKVSPVSWSFAFQFWDLKSEGFAEHFVLLVRSGIHYLLICPVRFSECVDSTQREDEVTKRTVARHCFTVRASSQ